MLFKFNNILISFIHTEVFSKRLTMFYNLQNYIRRKIMKKFLVIMVLILSPLASYSAEFQCPIAAALSQPNVHGMNNESIYYNFSRIKVKKPGSIFTAYCLYDKSTSPKVKNQAIYSVHCANRPRISSDGQSFKCTPK